MSAAPTDLFGYRERLTAAEKGKLAELRELLETRARPHLAQWWEEASSPAHLRGELAALHLEDDPGI
ncbi:MAG: mmgC 3, partial [Microbacterium sp.]|nr:mmgC 3 [Microbacterium sp.]